MHGLKNRLTWYRLRDPGHHECIYGDDIDEEEDAFRRAAKLAGFYQRPVEVCRVIGGGIVRPVGTPVDPGPTAPVG
ncbi:MAG TPA: hypothetical protein VGQ45_08975 [Gaiellales bacterium]|jgi:hypothetical protein|nr:hypothetical protein [Gaiellales bacterium]